MGSLAAVKESPGLADAVKAVLVSKGKELIMYATVADAEDFQWLIRRVANTDFQDSTQVQTLEWMVTLEKPGTGSLIDAKA